MFSLALNGTLKRVLVQPVQNKDIIFRRSYWQEIVKIRTEKDGTQKHEDPARVIKRFQEQCRSDGMSLLDLHFYNDRHEKAWMKRKRMADKRRYEFDKKHVMDLVKYIQFVKDNSSK
jgi:hypothetical protein